MWVDRLRSRRERLSLSLAEIGRRSGVDAATLRRAEQRGSDPRMSVLIAYADALNYPFAELFGDPRSPRS
jgi:transcriptional regulator with XRE-family HTH domain